ncbi:MAG: hypothetical protein EPGJADBJ_00672 [Saprospiraceae bacterium]|nr:hypothetical protein [Saprospiraceae bacterium]
MLQATNLPDHLHPDALHAAIQHSRGVILLHSRTIEKNPSDVEAYLARAAEYYMLGEIDAAQHDYEAVLTQHPGHSAALSGRGNCRNNRGEFALAIQDHTLAISLDPGRAELYMNRGNAYGNRGLLREALIDQTKAVELSPSGSWYYYNRAVTYERMGMPEEVLADCAKAIELTPVFPEAHFKRANAFAAIGKWKDALSSYNAVLATQPYNVDALVNAGQILLLMGQDNQAVTYLSKAAELGDHEARVAAQKVKAKLLRDS